MQGKIEMDTPVAKDLTSRSSMRNSFDDLLADSSKQAIRTAEKKHRAAPALLCSTVCQGLLATFATTVPWRQ